MLEEQQSAEYAGEPTAELDELASSPANDVLAQLDGLQEDLRQGLIALGQRLTRLEKHFETKILYDQAKDQTIDALHRELQDYRDGLQFQHLRPLVVDVLTVYDDLSAVLERFLAEAPEAASEVVAGLFEQLFALRDDLGGALEKHGFELYEHPGEVVDRAFQRVQATIPTDDPARDRTVARRVRRGLRYGERVIRPEIIEAYRYESGR